MMTFIMVVAIQTCMSFSTKLHILVVLVEKCVGLLLKVIVCSFLQLWELTFLIDSVYYEIMFLFLFCIWIWTILGFECSQKAQSVNVIAEQSFIAMSNQASFWIYFKAQSRMFVIKRIQFSPKQFRPSLSNRKPWFHAWNLAIWMLFTHPILPGRRRMDPDSYKVEE